MQRFADFSARQLKIPDLQQVVAFNASIRESDEWFEEPDELDRIEIILAALSDESEPVRAAAVAISRIARSQAFTEGNKRTALLVGIWILQNNGENPARYIPVDDLELGRLLLLAARGADILADVETLLASRK